jgi:hypothetical protein
VVSTTAFHSRSQCQEAAQHELLILPFVIMHIRTEIIITYVFSSITLQQTYQSRVKAIAVGGRHAVCRQYEFLVNNTSYLHTTRVTHRQHELPTDNTSYLQTTRITYREHELPTDNTRYLRTTRASCRGRSRDTWSMYTVSPSRLLNPDSPIFLHNAQTVQNLAEYVISGRVASWIGTLFTTIRR